MAYTPFKAIDVAGPKRDFVGYGRHVPKVRWPNDARVAISIVLNYEEGSEYSHANGDGRNDGLTEVIYAMDPKYRDLCAESVFEYGSRAGVWRLERLFTELKIPITFYAARWRSSATAKSPLGSRKPVTSPAATAGAGRKSWLLSRSEEEAEHIRRAIDSIKETCGERPSGWYCRYGPSVNTRELLVEEGGLRLRFRRLQRRPALLRRGEGQAAPRHSLFDDLQRREVRPAAELRLAGRFRRQPEARPRPALGRGRDPSADDVDRPASAPDRPGEPRRMRSASSSNTLQKKGKVWFTRRIDIANWWHQHHQSSAPDVAPLSLTRAAFSSDL